MEALVKREKSWLRNHNRDNLIHGEMLGGFGLWAFFRFGGSV